VLLLKLVHLEPLIPVQDWLKRLANLEQRLASREAPITSAPATPPASLKESRPQATMPTSEAPGDQDPAGAWRAFLNYVRREEDGPLAAKLTHCELINIADHCLFIKAGRAWTIGGAKAEARLKKLVEGFFGPEYSFHLEIQENDAPARPKAAPAKPLALADLKQQALEIFGGRWLNDHPEEESE
jgi:hypothetical protein